MAVSETAELLQEALALHRRGEVAEAAARYSALLQRTPHQAEAHYYLGLIACQQGRFADGAESARHALSGDPTHTHAHVLLGRALAALGRKDEGLASFDRALAQATDLAQVHGHRADLLSDLGRYGEAVEAYDRALALAPDRADDWFNRAVALNALGRGGEAIPSLEHAVACKPDFARAHALHATLLSDLGRHVEALQSADAAVAAAPGSAEAWLIRGRMCMAVGKPGAAIEAGLRSLELGETAGTKTLLADALRLTSAAASDDRTRCLLERALREGWARPHELIGAAIGVVKRDARISDCIGRAVAAWPARLPAAEVLAVSRGAALAQDLLFCRILQCAPVTDVALERLLINIRQAVLACVSDDVLEEASLSLACAIARQCFINEYVFSLTEQEAERADRLRALLEQALAAGTRCPASWPAAVGSYFPLHGLQNAAALLERSWPPCVKELLIQQIEEPLQERRLATTIPTLSDIGDGISRAVREQYEENPYPRWIEAGPPASPAVLRDCSPQHGIDILVAGCGTGFFTIELARAQPKARILAIDLSVASLSYAKRMAQRLDLSNVEFAQADIMKLASLGREFDFIEASGVLHHLADPWEGWRVLLSLLRSGGAMEVGLYSAAARRNVVAIREMIARRAYSPLPANIRLCREQIMAAPDGSLLKSVIQWSDFFSLSGCRDLLFHVQEHRMTLPDIKSFVTANDLQFTGFNLPAPVMQQFRARFPDSSAMTNLDCWHAFERDAGATFSNMYQFGVRKGPEQKGRPQSWVDAPDDIDVSSSPMMS